MQSKALTLYSLLWTGMGHINNFWSINKRIEIEFPSQKSLGIIFLRKDGFVCE